MEDLNAVNKRVHKIMMTNRRTCTINGVCDVLSFDAGNRPGHADDKRR